MSERERDKAAPSEQLFFAVIAIESAARKYSTDPSELTRRLARQGLIDGRLWKYYDMLHTQSRDYVADDLMETLKNRERRAYENKGVSRGNTCN